MSILLVINPIPEIDHNISHCRCILLSLARSDPLRSSHLRDLALLYNSRCVQSGLKEDLDRSITSCTEAIFVASPWDKAGQDTVQGFYLLASMLQNRLQLFNQSSDARYSLEYLRYLESQPLEALGISTNEVKTSFVVALAAQVRLRIGNVAQDIEEMTIRCRNLLASDIPHLLLRPAIQALIDANDVYYKQSNASEYPEEVIECLREANKCHYSHEFSSRLAVLLSLRFQETGSMEDYEEAVTL